VANSGGFPWMFAIGAGDYGFMEWVLQWQPNRYRFSGIGVDLIT
jgi:hypothetical protein